MPSILRYSVSAPYAHPAAGDGPVALIDEGDVVLPGTYVTLEEAADDFALRTAGGEYTAWYGTLPLLALNDFYPAPELTTLQLDDTGIVGGVSTGGGAAATLGAGGEVITWFDAYAVLEANNVTPESPSYAFCFLGEGGAPASSLFWTDLRNTWERTE